MVEMSLLPRLKKKSTQFRQATHSIYFRFLQSFYNSGPESDQKVTVYIHQCTKLGKFPKVPAPLLIQNTQNIRGAFHRKSVAFWILDNDSLRQCLIIKVNFSTIETGQDGTPKMFNRLKTSCWTILSSSTVYGSWFRPMSWETIQNARSCWSPSYSLTFVHTKHLTNLSIKIYSLIGCFLE